MLTNLTLIGYRGFLEHSLPFRGKTVIVGKNNAGKSTIVEALRLLSFVTSRYLHLNYLPPPRSLGISRDVEGVSPSLKNTDIDLTHVSYKYRDKPAVIEATFASKERVKIYLTSEQDFFAVIYDKSGRIVRNRAHAQRVRLPKVVSLPQIGPLVTDEKVLTQKYLNRVKETVLAPQHFRNHLFGNQSEFATFKRLAEESWPGLRMWKIEKDQTPDGFVLELMLQDGEYVSEVGRMGHGLQIWLQTIWFLSRIGTTETVILDEPDVYLHADLQRRLIRRLLKRPNQLITTSHSVEVMSETSPDQMLVVDKKSKSSAFATSAPVVQALVDRIGGITNLNLTRLWTTKRLLLFEGKDISIFKCFQNAVDPDEKIPIGSIPSMPIGGWGGWDNAVGSSMLLKNQVGESITTYCILDSDFNTPNAIQKRKTHARKRGIQLHIWRRKEIENYLLVSAVIYRAIARSVADGVDPPTEKEIATQLDAICETMKEEITQKIADSFSQEDRKRAVSTAMKMATPIVNKNWKSLNGKLKIAPGKKVLSKFSDWSQKHYGVSLNATTLGRNMSLGDVDPEVQNVYWAIEKGVPF